MLALTSSSCKITQRYATPTCVLMNTGFLAMEPLHIPQYTAVQREHETRADIGFNPSDKINSYYRIWNTPTLLLLIRKYYFHAEFSRWLGAEY
jgi:hypothetical protein